MTDMITFHGRPRRRAAPIPVITESARLRQQVRDFAADLKREVEQLRREVKDRGEDHDDD